MKSIGDQVADYLAAHPGLKKDDLAALVRKHPGGEKVGRQVISNLVKNTTTNPGYLRALAAAMGTTMDTLANGLFVAEVTKKDDPSVTKDTQSEANECPIPMTAPFNPVNVAATIKLLGRYFMSFDEDSKVAVEPLLRRLLYSPDRADAVARKIAKLAEEQEDISTDPVINATMKRGRSTPVETKPLNL